MTFRCEILHQLHQTELHFRILIELRQILGLDLSSAWVQSINLFALSLQYGCWNSTQYRCHRCYAVRSSKQPESLLAFWPFCCRISGWRECWAQTQRLGNSKHFLSDCLPILLETAFLQENPVFHNWTLVYVPYCDGTSFSGDAVRSGVAESVKGCVLAILVGVFVGAALPLVIWLRDTGGYQKCSLQLMCGRQTPFALGLPIVNACRLSQLSDKEVAPVIPVYCVQPYAPHVLEPLVWILDQHCT